MNRQQQSQIGYLLSFLLILVERAGGKLVVENLSEFAGSNLYLSMDLDVENDRVAIYSRREKGSLDA